MKKLIVSMLSIICCMSCLTACNPSPNGPTQPQLTKLELLPIEWQYSDTKHWHLPKPDENGIIETVVYGYGDHVDCDNDRICDVCGYFDYLID